MEWGRVGGSRAGRAERERLCQSTMQVERLKRDGLSKSAPALTIMLQPGGPSSCCLLALLLLLSRASAANGTALPAGLCHSRRRTLSAATCCRGGRLRPLLILPCWLLPLLLPLLRQEHKVLGGHGRVDRDPQVPELVLHCCQRGGCGSAAALCGLGSRCSGHARGGSSPCSLQLRLHCCSVRGPAGCVQWWFLLLWGGGEQQALRRMACGIDRPPLLKRQQHSLLAKRCIALKGEPAALTVCDDSKERQAREMASWRRGRGTGLSAPAPQPCGRLRQGAVITDQPSSEGQAGCPPRSPSP